MLKRAVRDSDNIWIQNKCKANLYYDCNWAIFVVLMKKRPKTYIKESKIRQIFNILGRRVDAIHFEPNLLYDFGLRKYFDVKCAQTASKQQPKQQPNYPVSQYKLRPVVIKMSRRKIFDLLAIIILVLQLFLYTIYSICKEQIFILQFQ